MKRCFVFMFVLIIGLTACQSEPEVIPTPTPSPLDVAAQAGQAMQQVKAMHFSFFRDGAPAFVDADETLIFRSAEGDYVAPDRLQATVKLLAGAFVTQVDTVVVGEGQWLTNLLTGDWEALPKGWGLDPSTFFDAKTGIPNILTSGLTALTLDGPLQLEEAEGEFWYLVGEADGEQVSAMSGGMVPPGRVDFEAWVDPTTYLVRRIRLVLPDSDPAEPTEWLIDFSNYDEVVPIKPPPGGDG